MVTCFPTKQPLPPNSFDQNDDPSFESAYDSCLGMERDHLNDTYVIHARYLGYLITELPKDGAQAVAKEINLCNNDHKMLKELSEFYIYSLIGLVKENKVHTPTPPSPDSRSFKESYVEVADPAPRDHATAKHSALKRDNYRCMVTGAVESDVYRHMSPEQLERYNIEPDVYVCPTKYCHIFSPSISWNSIYENTNRKQTWISSSLSILASFGFVDLQQLNGSKGHSLTNGLSLNMALHTCFNDLYLWFEYLPKHPQPNTYHVQCVFNIIELSMLPPERTVTFTSTDPSLPLPNPKYLQFHAAISRAAQLSGLARYLVQQEDKIKNASGLAQDGSSAGLLQSALNFYSLTVRAGSN